MYKDNKENYTPMVEHKRRVHLFKGRKGYDVNK